MRKITFKSAKFQKQFQEQINKEILEGLQKGKGPVGKSYIEHVEKASMDLVKRVAKSSEKLARAQYKMSLDEVGDALVTGIRGSVNNNTVRARKRFKGITLDNWSALSRKYFVHKRKYFTENSSSFWKRSGKLAAAYKGFSATYKSAVNRSRHKQKLTGIRFRQKKVILSYRIDFRFPSPTKGGEFFDAIFLKSFFQQREFSLAGQPAGGGLDLIGYLEGLGDSPRYRPFISRLMSSRGGKFNKDLVRMLNQFTLDNKVR